jgi:hypothetical protein
MTFSETERPVLALFETGVPLPSLWVNMCTSNGPKDVGSR